MYLLTFPPLSILACRCQRPAPARARRECEREKKNERDAQQHMHAELSDDDDGGAPTRSAFGKLGTGTRATTYLHCRLRGLSFFPEYGHGGSWMRSRASTRKRVMDPEVPKITSCEFVARVTTYVYIKTLASCIVHFPNPHFAHRYKDERETFPLLV
jgi:hypothetical protein